MIYAGIGVFFAILYFITIIVLFFKGKKGQEIIEAILLMDNGYIFKLINTKKEGKILYLGEKLTLYGLFFVYGLRLVFFCFLITLLWPLAIAIITYVYIDIEVDKAKELRKKENNKF